MGTLIVSLYTLFGGVGYLINDVTGMVFGVVLISVVLFFIVGWKSL